MLRAVDTAQLGPLGPVSRLTLGGGGIGAVWGPTTRAEAVATVQEAAAGGITLFDMAPTYGQGEAETVIGEAFGGHPPEGAMFTTKHVLGNPPANEVYDRLSRSLDESLARMRLDAVDLFILHGQVGPDMPGAPRPNTPLDLFRSAVAPAFERIREQGRIRAWGITAVGVPSAILDILDNGPRPDVCQCITNPLDALGEMRRFEEDPRPRQIIGAAVRNDVAVMGIRAVAAGSLTDAIDRELREGHPGLADYDRAAPLRAIAAEKGVSTAHLAHRYALSMPGVATAVLGVKNREELRDCLAAESAGRLPDDLMRQIDHALNGGA
jgi:aryl-alcohol dehydrogenase-like predicted oxidoreductase